MSRGDSPEASVSPSLGEPSDPFFRRNRNYSGFINGLPTRGRAQGGRVNGFTNGLTKARVNGFINGMNRGRVNGFINGLARGRVNGFTNGLTKGRVNGFTNGITKGRVNGLINDLKGGRVNGLTNGKRGFFNGLINGLDRKNGWVNGNGFINGFRLTNVRRGIPLQRRNFPMRVAAVMVVAAIIILTPFYLISLMPDTAIKIDGYFFDWDRAGYFVENMDTASPDIDIREYSIVVWQNTVYCYISTEGRMFPLDEGSATAFYAMFDIDNNPGTGYIVDDIGADLMVKIVGWNGTIQLSHMSDFINSANRSDFKGFGIDFWIRAMAENNQLEFSFQTSNIENPTVRFFAKSWTGEEDSSMYVIKYQAPAMRATAEFVMPDVILPNVRERVINLVLEGQRGDIAINGFDFQRLGNATEYALYLYEGEKLISTSGDGLFELISPLVLREGHLRSLAVFAEVEACENICSFGMTLNATGVMTDDCTVVVEERQTLSKVSYVGSIPDGIIIDGAFADWMNGYVMLDGDNDVAFENGGLVADESVDILEYGMHVGTRDLSMYISVDDKICNGSLLPIDIILPISDQGLPLLETPELMGADVAAAVIDVDINTSTGAEFGDIMRGDYLVFIAGKKGKILLSELYEWDDNDNGSWSLLDSVKSAVDNRRMEFGFNLSHIPLDNNTIAVVGFFMTDWKGGTDYSDSLFPLGRWQEDWYKKEFGGIMINEVGHFKSATDYVEFYNTGTEPISLDGWVLYDGRTPIYTFEDVVINPGELFVIEGFELSRVADIILVDDQGVVIDDVRTSEKKDKSWGRTGDPPYPKWKVLTPTPGELNDGQTIIPEFSSILLPILVIVFLPLMIRIRKTWSEKDGE